MVETAARTSTANTGTDPRFFQIAVLGGLLIYGTSVLGFDQSPGRIAVIVCATLATQWTGQRLTTPAVRFDPLSPLVTALSLCLLLRTSAPVELAVAAILAVGSKFVLRIDGKHLFNPANFGISVMLLCSGCAWISPAQWGAKTIATVAFASLAALVLSKAKRADTALAFLAAYIGILLTRALYFGDPMAIPLKQMQSGALLLFAFFMITDPKTTPDRRAGRILYGGLVAALAAVLQFGFYLPQGLMLALFVASPLVPVIDSLMPRPREAVRFSWARPVLN